VTTYPLHIALQDGFNGDSVTINVNSEEVFQHQSVQTRWQIGYADAVEVQVAAGSVAIRIDVPSKQTFTDLTIQADRPMYLGVSLTAEGAITCRVSQEPFGYV
jgi:hypothetical protein